MGRLGDVDELGETPIDRPVSRCGVVDHDLEGGVDEILFDRHQQQIGAEDESGPSSSVFARHASS